MAQDAGLGGNLPAVSHLVKERENLPQPVHGIRHRVEPQYRVARAEGQPLQQGGQNTVGIVGGVIGLQAAAQGAGQADGGIAVGRDGDFIRRRNQVQAAHQLGRRGGHLRRQPPGDAPDIGAGGGLGQQPLPKVRHGPALDRAVDGLVEIVLDDAGDLVVLIGHRRVLPQVLQRQPGQHNLGRHALLGVRRRDSGQLVAGFFLIGLGQHFLHRRKSIDLAKQHGF